MSKVSQDRASKNYQEKLADHLSERPIYDDEAVADINRICHVGRASCQLVLEVLSVAEASHDRQDKSMRGMPWDYSQLEGSEEIDRTFMPGQIGGVAVQLSSLDWE